MRFAFDDQQREFAAQLRALTDKSCGPADIREAWASELGWSRERWEALAEMGVVGLTVPEAHGGLGFGLLDLVLLLEEAGRAGLPEPVLETTALAVPLLVAAADSADGGSVGGGSAAGEISATWLAKVAAGDAVLTVATQDLAAVPAAMAADLLLLERDGEVHAVTAADVALTARPSLDGARRAAAVSFAPSPATLVASGAEATALVASVRDRAAMATGAVLLGVADRLLAITAGYARERFQFGHAIGSFQAVKHHLANALIRLEFARPAVYRAAWSLDRGDADAGVHASMAKALAAEAATGAARVALQVHGAIGYTWECDIQLWMKPAWALAGAWGDAGFHRARVLERLLAEAG